MSLSRAVLPVPLPILAQSSAEIVDASRLNEIERLRNGGSYQDGTGGFVLYVITPLAILLCLILLVRRMVS